MPALPEKLLRQLLVPLLLVLSLFAPFFYVSFETYDDAGVLYLLYLNYGVLAEILIFLLVISIAYKTGKVGRWFSYALTALVPLILVTQFMHLYYAGSLLGEVTLDHADQAALIVSTKNIVLFLIYPLYVVLLLLWLRSTAQSSARFGLVTALFVVLLGTNFAVYAAYDEGLISGDKVEEGIEENWPVSGFFSTLVRYYLLEEAQRSEGALDLALARDFGFDFLEQNGVKKRSSMYGIPFPYERIGTPASKPNVLVLFIESLSARMVGAYDKQNEGITPNLDEFAEEAMRVEGYVNHTTPTVPGLFGQLCSIYPPYKAELKGLKGQGPRGMECLPSILAGKLGYRTLYLSHSNPKYAKIGKLLSTWGFQEQYLWRALLKEYLYNEPPLLRGSGPSDHQMMRSLVNFLEQEQQQLLGEEPFFMGVSTVETHTGRSINSDDGVPFGDGTSDVKNLFYSMDDAFGQFWRYFRNSPYADNTIVIVTADHALFPSIDYKRTAGKDYTPTVYDDVALMIYDPFHDLPERLEVKASTLDFAPSVYHLLEGDPDKQNRLMGLSIFGDRQQTAGTVSLSAYDRFGYMVVDDSGIRRRKSFECDSENDPYCDKDSRLLSIVRTLQDLVRERRYW